MFLTNRWPDRRDSLECGEDMRGQQVREALGQSAAPAHSAPQAPQCPPLPPGAPARSPGGVFWGRSVWLVAQ